MQLLAPCLHVPADRLEARGGVLALRLVGHGVEGDVVGVVNEDQVVQLLVTGESDGLESDALLHAAVTGERDHVVVEDRMLGGVEAGGGHLAGERETDGVGDPLAERASGGLDTGGLVELGVAGGLRVELAEILQLLKREVVAAEMQPRVEEHRAVAGGEDKAITVEPARLRRVVHERVTVEDGTELGGAERQPEMAGAALVDRIDGETAGDVAGFGEDFDVERHGNSERGCLKG